MSNNDKLEKKIAWALTAIVAWPIAAEDTTTASDPRG